MSEEIENRESRGEQKPSDVVVFSPEVLAMADRRRRQKAEELETCRQAAEDGDSQAQVQMGLHYIYGTHGVERDGKKAFEWFSQTASDDPVGRYWLGVCYDNGTGVERDGDRAFELFKESADMGYAPAQCDLGVCYETGQGTEPDLDMAIELYKQSAEQDYPMAKCNLGALYYFAAGVERDYDKAARYFTEAAEQRLPRAQHLLGRATSSATASRRIRTRRRSCMRRRAAAAAPTACARWAFSATSAKARRRTTSAQRSSSARLPTWGFRARGTSSARAMRRRLRRGGKRRAGVQVLPLRGGGRLPGCALSGGALLYIRARHGARLQQGVFLLPPCRRPRPRGRNLLTGALL